MKYPNVRKHLTAIETFRYYIKRDLYIIPANYRSVWLWQAYYQQALGYLLEEIGLKRKRG